MEVWRCGGVDEQLPFIHSSIRAYMPSSRMLPAVTVPIYLATVAIYPTY